MKIAPNSGKPAIELAVAMGQAGNSAKYKINLTLTPILKV